MGNKFEDDLSSEYMHLNNFHWKNNATEKKLRRKKIFLIKQ